MPVIVKYPNGQAIVGKHPVIDLLETVRKSANLRRAYLRALQPYMVNLLSYEFKKAQQHGLILEVLPGIWEWLGEYDCGQDGKHGQGILLNNALSAENYLW